MPCRPYKTKEQKEETRVAHLHRYKMSRREKRKVSDATRVYNKQYKREKREWVDNYKLSRGCEICGYNKAPEALDFDHLPGFEKRIIVACLVNTTHSYETLKAEIDKCRILCANCHRIVSRRQNIERLARKKEAKKFDGQLMMFDIIELEDAS